MTTRAKSQTRRREAAKGTKAITDADIAAVKSQVLGAQIELDPLELARELTKKDLTHTEAIVGTAKMLALIARELDLIRQEMREPKGFLPLSLLDAESKFARQQREKDQILAHPHTACPAGRTAWRDREQTPAPRGNSHQSSLKNPSAKPAGAGSNSVPGRGKFTCRHGRGNHEIFLQRERGIGSSKIPAAAGNAQRRVRNPRGAVAGGQMNLKSEISNLKKTPPKGGTTSTAHAEA